MAKVHGNKAKKTSNSSVRVFQYDTSCFVLKVKFPICAHT